MNGIKRREFLQLAATSTAVAYWPGLLALTEKQSKVLQKKIPASGESLTVIGMGTWQTFNVGSDKQLRDARTQVLKVFFDNGGQMIDSSPMYGSSQAVVGYGLAKLGYPKSLFSADKIWTSDGHATREQLAKTAARWGIETFDLMQVHNLVSWEQHLENLKDIKAAGKLRYIGITTSHGRRHRELEKVMTAHDLDFVQLTYNMLDREVEDRLLPLAKEKEIAVIVNRPFQGGRLVNKLKRNNHPLPDWVKNFDCHNWPQFLLKFIVSHPAVTCAIPATSQRVHMHENMGAALGTLPDAKTRQQMLDYLHSL